jgi:hypothetical protein
MGWPTFRTAGTGSLVLFAAVLGWAAEGGGTGESPLQLRPARAGETASGPAPRVRPAAVVTPVEPHRVANRPPRFRSVAPRMAQEGVPYQYGVAADDPDGDAVKLTLLRAPEGAALDGTLLRWQPSHAQAGRRQRFTLRAVDGHGAGRIQTWTVVPRPVQGGRNSADAQRHR